LFAKDLDIPIPLLQAEALEGRYTENQEKLAELKSKIKALRSGYNGEKTINYYLKLIPNEKYYIFHDLRLPAGNTFFQIDALLLSSKLILMLEGKNHSGTLRFEKNQMIQEVNSTKEVYENPISQSNRHRILLRYLFGNEKVPKIPIDYFVVVCKSSTEIIISPGYTEAENKVIKVSDLLWKIEELERNFKKEFLNTKEIERVRDLLLKKHTPNRMDILKKFEIAEANVITGVQCPNCSSIPMNYKRKNWTCPECHFSSKDAHLKAVDDYFLIMKTSITNKELRRFLHLPSSRSATYIFFLLNLPHIGNSRSRVYYYSGLFPLSSNYVFPHKTNTIINKNRGNMDEKNLVHS
jgi:ssDNA-binding Zn-finger/Zn-ribbon topoisomerase 1